MGLALDDADAHAHLGQESGFEEADGAGADGQDRDLLDRIEGSMVVESLKELEEELELDILGFVSFATRLWDGVD